MSYTQIVGIGLLVGFATTNSYAQALNVSTNDGGAVTTELGYGIKVNKGSTLRRAWVVINDPTAPVQLSGAGVSTEYGDRDYRFVPTGTAKPSVNVSALEVRYLLFDMFGDHIKTLSGTEVADVTAGAELQLKDVGSWRAWENQVADLLTVVSFVANVRTSEGKIWRYREKPISEELNRVRLKVTTGALDPKKEEK